MLGKEWRSLIASRAWWVMVAVTGPLIGVLFMRAVRAFSEVSDGAGIACGIPCDPLVGIWAPTFGGFEVVALFLLPFVAIRLVGHDRLTGTLTMEHQLPLSVHARVLAKVIVLMAGVMVASLAGLVAVALWAWYGGTVSWPELVVVATGHLLNGMFAITLGTVVAAHTQHPSTAAVIALAITVGTWVMQFAAAVYGGVWLTVAGYTPGALVATFQHGLFDVHLLLDVLLLTAAGLGIASAGLDLGSDPSRRRRRVAQIAVIAALGLAVTAWVPLSSWDLSEARLNSFAEAEQRRLQQLPGPLTITAQLAPEDPRRADLERRAFSKLRRALPEVDITYSSRTTTGLFEQSDSGYGEITYSIGPRSTRSRVFTDDGVLEAIWETAGLTAPAGEEDTYFGDPLVTRPTGAALIFFGLWPVATGAAALCTTRWRLRRPPRVPHTGGHV